MSTEDYRARFRATVQAHHATTLACYNVTNKGESMPHKPHYKTIRALQNNGPDHWLIFEGVKIFGIDPIATCTLESDARLIVDALNK